MRLSLRTRLTAIAAAGATVVFGVAMPLLHRELSSALSNAITEQLAVRINDLDESREATPARPGSSLVISQVAHLNGQVLSPSDAEPLLAPDELAQAAQDQLTVDRAVPGVGDPARVLARPIDTAGTVIGIAATSTAVLVDARRRLVLILGAAGPLLVATVAAVAWALSGAALRPVRRMATEAATISNAQQDPRLPQPATDDEIAELARTLNGMLARIGSSTARQRAYVDDAAHELRTPIAVLRGELELAALKPADTESVKQSLMSAIEETDRLNRIAENLLTLARADAGQLSADDATTDLLATSRRAVQRIPHHNAIRVEVRGEALCVKGRSEWFEHIVSNLVTNAQRFARTAILVTIRQVDGSARLEVADDGPGFPPELIPHAFDRFSRGRRERGSGAGLGLAIVASLAHAAGGTVGARNGMPLGGACVTAELQLAQ